MYTTIAVVQSTKASEDGAGGEDKVEGEDMPSLALLTLIHTFYSLLHSGSLLPITANDLEGALELRRLSSPTAYQRPWLRRKGPSINKILH